MRVGLTLLSFQSEPDKVLAVADNAGPGGEGDRCSAMAAAIIDSSLDGDPIARDDRDG